MAAVVSSTMTAGPPSVAILVAATLPSNADIRRRLRRGWRRRGCRRFRRWRRALLPPSATGASASAAGPARPASPRSLPSPGLPASPLRPASALPASARRASRARPAASGVCPAGAGTSVAASGTAAADILRRLLRDRRIDAQHRQRRRRVVVLPGKHRLGRRPSRAEGWQIPHARRATGPRRQARTPGSTSTARSRRTGNESRGAWTRVPPSLDVWRAIEPRERGDHCVAGFAACARARIRPI